MQQEALLPLSLSDFELLRPSRWEDRLVWFPIIGWVIGGHLQYRRIGRARFEVHQQLLGRDRFPVNAWKTTDIEPARAEKVARAIADRVGWPNHHFLPEDSLSLLLLDEDGMGFFEASYAIEHELGVDLRLGAMPLEGSFRDLVECVYAPAAGA